MPKTKMSELSKVQLLVACKNLKNNFDFVNRLIVVPTNILSFRIWIAHEME